MAWCQAGRLPRDEPPSRGFRDPLEPGKQRNRSLYVLFDSYLITVLKFLYIYFIFLILFLILFLMVVFYDLLFLFVSKISLGGGSLERTAAVRLRLAGAEPSEGGQRAAGALVGGQSRREEAPRPPFLGSFSSFVSTLDAFFSLIFNGTSNIYFFTFFF